MTANWTSALARARAHAPYLALGLDRMPALEALLAAGDGEGALAWAKAAGHGAESVASALRREKLALAVALAVGDLAGAFPLLRVTGELTAFADRAMDAAIADAIRARVADAEPAGFLALALGKHGAGELNFSSDIDPILLYDPALLPRRERDEPGEAAQRVARTLMQTMSHVDGEGYVFRVDLRLRPASEVSPLAIPIEAALTHYESSALAWERAAFIRARPCAGDLAAGEAFLAAIRSFVWRKSLDFGAITEIGRLTQRIRANHSGPARPGPGFNLKQGRGGIREVEFFAQTHQLIHGGRHPAIRVRGTRASLDALAAEGLIDPADAKALGDSYDRLRTIEHRLQMVEDQQTHTLPSGAALDTVAALHGLADGAMLVALLRDATFLVGERFDALLCEGEAMAPVPAMADVPDELLRRVGGWTDGRFAALRSQAAQGAFDSIRPALLASLAAADDPGRTLARWETMLARLPTAINLFRLLEARPGLFDLVADCLTLAPPLADELARKPDLLDALIDRSARDRADSVAQLARAMRQRERGDDYEKRLDRIRIVTGEVRFALGVQLIEGVEDPLAIAAALSRTAEAALQVALEAAAEEFARRHGTIPGSELVVLGLGRLGGGLLTHASDLDIIYLFTGSHDAESDGERPLGATLYYNRLAQRVTAALSVPTAQGALYEVDTRLRPQGNQGPLAVSVESFARYQRDDAWTWEHMALERARVLVGSEAARAEVEREIAAILTQPRDPARLRDDVLAMRREMALHKAAAGLLDAKLLRGGLVDIEFLVHYLQLRHCVGLTPDLRHAIAALVEAGLLPPALGPARDLLTRLLVGTRLLAPDLGRPVPAAAATLARHCGTTDFAALEAALGSARHAVAGAWRAIFDEDLELDR